MSWYGIIGRRTPRLSPRQSARGADARGARPDRREGAGGLHLRRCGALGRVSSAAPYRHFRDRDALIADVARRGFELFAERLDRAWNEGRPDPSPRFRMSAAPISPSRATSRPTTRPCSRPACRSTPIRSCARSATAPSRVLRQASESCSRRQLPADRRPPAADDEPAYLGAVARHRLAVRARRRRAAASCRWRRRTCSRPAC